MQVKDYPGQKQKKKEEGNIANSLEILTSPGGVFPSNLPQRHHTKFLAATLKMHSPPFFFLLRFVFLNKDGKVASFITRLLVSDI